MMQINSEAIPKEISDYFLKMYSETKGELTRDNPRNIQIEPIEIDKEHPEFTKGAGYDKGTLKQGYSVSFQIFSNGEEISIYINIGVNTMFNPIR